MNKPKKITASKVERQYASNPSFSDLLPWLEWSDEKNMVLLEDGRSVGAILEIKDISCEAKPRQFIKDLHHSITKMFSTIVPLEAENPWIIQFYVQDELSLKGLEKRLDDYTMKRGNCSDEFTQHYLKLMREHGELMTKSEGIFKDPLSDLPFCGKTRRIRMVVYRRYAQVKKQLNINVIEELEHVIQKLMSQLRQIGLHVEQSDGAEFYDWLVRWFNPNPQKTNGNINQLLNLFPYRKNKKPGWSLTQNIFFGPVKSEAKNWIFDNLKHKVLVCRELQEPIDIGVISRERDFGESSKYALLDKFPVGSIYTIQIVFESKNQVKKHLTKLEKASIGKGIIVKDILRNIEQAHREIENHNMLFRTVEALYIRGKTDQELKRIETDITALLNHSGLDVVASDQELYPLDTYLRFLPFNFNYDFDRKRTYRSNYKFADDIGRLLPIYGRSRGDDQHPLFVYYNRAGEPFIFDPLNKNFKMSNSHMAVIGTTGAGKSVLLNTMILSLSAIYNPRIVVMEIGGSFDLTAQYLKHHGRHVKRVYFDRTNPMPINPYADAYKALDQIEQEEALLAKESKSHTGIEEEVIAKHSEKIQQELNSKNQEASDIEQTCVEDRDLLNEMVLSTRLMITQGDPKEESKIDLTDMTLINRALIHAMKTCRKNHASQMRIMHVRESFQKLSDQEIHPKLKSRLHEFSLRLEYYVQDLLRSKFLNHEAEPLGDYDFLQIDFGFLKEQSYQDLMNIVCIALLSKILSLAETHKTDGRPMILILDEAHVLFKSEMVATFVTLMAKVARKVGLWLIPCTQNVTDFATPESQKILSMIETWIVLSLDAQEVAHIEKFKQLTEKMRALIADIKKYPGIYSEGVLLGKRYQGLFRNVPPRVALSLALTDPEERTERARVQKEKGLSEIEAVEYMAEQMISKQQKTH